MSGFWLVDRQAPAQLRFAKLVPAFDIRKIAKLSESGYLLRQQTFMNKGIKKFKVFETNSGKNYLFMATYSFTTVEAPAFLDTYPKPEQFPPAARAPNYQYWLQTFTLP